MEVLCTKSATLRSVNCWLRSRVVCQMCSWSWYLHWCWSDDAYPGHWDMFEVFCCPSTTTKHTSICVKRSDAVVQRGAGVFQALLRLHNTCRSFEATHGQASVCAERRCTADFQSLLLGPHSAVTAQVILALNARMYFIPSGSAECIAASTALCLATWFLLLAHVTPQRTLLTALFDFISAGHFTNCVFYHWRPSTIGDRTFPATAASVWNSLPESVRSSQSLQVFHSRPKTELFARSYRAFWVWLRTSHFIDYYYVTSLFRLTVTCPCSFRTQRHAKVYSSIIIFTIINRQLAGFLSWAASLLFKTWPARRPACWPDRQPC